MRKIALDAELSGTGVWDVDEGWFLPTKSLNVSLELQARIGDWVTKYENAYFTNFSNIEQCQALDVEGLSIAEDLEEEFVGGHVIYYYSQYKTQRFELGNDD